jgi:hypothetical protein
MSTKEGDPLITASNDSLYDLDASLFVLSRLWTPHAASNNSYQHLNILDTVVIDGTSIIAWLFTTKDGEVKSRASKNRSRQEITARLFADPNATSDCILGQTRYIDAFISGSIPRSSGKSSSFNSQFKKIRSVTDFEDVYAREGMTKLILARPSKLQEEEKYLKIVCQNGKLGIQNLKCFLMVDSAIKGYAVPPSDQNQLAGTKKRMEIPYKEVSCRNKIILDLAKDFTNRFLKILESNNNNNSSSSLGMNKRKIQKLSFLVLLEDLSKDPLSASINSQNAIQNTFQFWFHSVEEITFESSLFPLGEALPFQSQASQSSLHSDMSLSKISSNKMFLNLQFHCTGDFCEYHPIHENQTFLKNRGGAGGGTALSSPRKTSTQTMNILDLIFEDVDIKTESHKAIKRHKRDDSFQFRDESDNAYDNEQDEEEATDQTNNDRNESNGTDEQQDGEGVDKTGDENNNDDDHSLNASTDRQSMNSMSQQKKPKKYQKPQDLLSQKKYQILNKSISLAREEMSKFELIEKKISHLFQPVNFEEVLEIRNVIQEIWPQEIAKYWFHEGKLKFIEKNQNKSIYSVNAGSSSSAALSLLGGSSALNPVMMRNKSDLSTSSLASLNSSLSSSLGGKQKRLPSVLKEKMNLLNEFHQSFDESLETKPFTALPGGEENNKHNNSHSSFSGKSGADSISENKWFAVQFSQAQVCEHCYNIYQQLEKHRILRNEKLKKNKILLLDSQLNSEEKKLRDRKLEKKIFEQRKSISKLAKSKSAPSSLQQEQSNHHSQQHGNNQKKSMRRSSRGLLPPLPWNLAAKSTDPENQQQLDLEMNEQYFQSSSGISKHIMNRNPVPIPSKPYESEEEEKRKANALFEEMRRNYENSLQNNFSFKPTINEPLKPVKPGIAIKDYNPEHLLHEWHRDMKRLRTIIHEKKAGNNPLSGLSEIANQPLGAGGGRNEKENLPSASFNSSGEFGGFAPSSLERNLSKLSIKEEDENEDDEEGMFGAGRGQGHDDEQEEEEMVGEQLGWNPFVLK